MTQNETEEVKELANILKNSNVVEVAKVAQGFIDLYEYLDKIKPKFVLEDSKGSDS